MKLLAYCEACGHKHPIDLHPGTPDNQVSDWYVKHGGHAGVGVMWPGRTPKPSWIDRLRGGWLFRRFRSRPALAAGHVAALPAVTAHGMPLRHPAIESFLPNANIKIAYAASAAPTLTLASLAASSTLLAGRGSSSVSNASNLYVDYYTGGFFKQAATNTAAGTIKVGVVGAVNDTPTWPDVITGSDAALTWTTQARYDAAARVVAAITTAATASAVNPFAPVGMAQFFGYVVPTAFVYFVSHSAQTSTNAWDATEGSHSLKYTPVFFTAI